MNAFKYLGTWPTVVYFYGPIGCLLLVNSVLFIITLTSIYRLQVILASPLMAPMQLSTISYMLYSFYYKCSHSWFQKSIESERTVQLWRSHSQTKRSLGQVKDR